MIKGTVSEKASLICAVKIFTPAAVTGIGDPVL